MAVVTKGRTDMEVSKVPRTIIAAAMLVAMAAPASATEWIHCNDAADEVQIGLLAGHFTFLNVSRATLRVDEKHWSSDPQIEPGLPLGTAQLYFGDDQLLVDLVDGDHELLAQLRVYTADDVNAYVQGGVLRVVDHGAWIVSCEGP
jgi:hypothetical protein